MEFRLTVAIVTYRRAAICLETIHCLLPLLEPKDELMIVEQGDDGVRQQFKGISKCLVKFIYLPRAGTVSARNAAIQNAEGKIIVFLDDDVIPSPQLLEAHAAAYDDHLVGGVAGRILGPSDQLRTDTDSAPEAGWMETDFAMQRKAWIEGARGCNMSFRRELLLLIGGFDTGFRQPFFFREETDVCFRVRSAGYRMLFEPDAMLQHIEAKSGGTRDQTAKPPSPIISEMTMYRLHFCPYRDNLYFLLKHFNNATLFNNVWKTYRIYVGLSRWPWRLFAKNLRFLAAILNAAWFKYARGQSFFDPAPIRVISILPTPTTK